MDKYQLLKMYDKSIYMINKKINETSDKKLIQRLEYSLEELQIDKRLADMTYDYDLSDWRKIKTDKYYEFTDGLSLLDKKRYLLSLVKKIEYGPISIAR